VLSNLFPRRDRFGNPVPGIPKAPLRRGTLIGMIVIDLLFGVASVFFIAGGFAAIAVGDEGAGIFGMLVGFVTVSVIVFNHVRVTVMRRREYEQANQPPNRL
jgi:membrane protein implicated in regulation of membrane protease activity